MFSQNRSSNWVKRLALSLLIVIIVSSFSAVNNSTLQWAVGADVVAAEDWPMFHHDAQNIGYSQSTAPNTNNTQWSYTAGGNVTSSPAIANGRVYVGSKDNKVYCLNSTTGALMWSYLTGGDVDSSPAVSDNKVFVGSDDHMVYCLHAETGEFIWAYQTIGVVQSSPAVADGRVFVGSQDTKIYCISALNGAFIWSYQTGNSISSSPAVAGTRVYAGSDDGKIYCLDTTTGALIWSYQTGSAIRSSPAVFGIRVYVGSSDDKVYCLDATTGGLVWSYTSANDVTSSPAVADGRVFVGSTDNKIYALDATAGGFLWSYTTGGSVRSSPAVADGKVYIGSDDNKLYCLNVATGTLNWSYLAGGVVSASPAVAGGSVYVSSTDQKVYAFSAVYLLAHFDSAFRYRNVRMIYPSERTPKPLGCAAAMVSDWLSSAFIYTKLETVMEGIDTDSTFVDQATGKPVGDAGAGIVSFGGPVVNPVVAYAESAETPASDRAPIKFYQNSGVFYFQLQDGTSIGGAELPASVINGNQDMFVIEMYRDGDGRYTLLCYGFGWKGTYAAGKYFDAEIYPNIDNYQYTWLIAQWTDTNGNGFVNTAADGDTYTLIATD